MQVRHAFLCFGLLLSAEGCAKVKAAVCADMVPAPKPGTAAAKPAAAGGVPAGSDDAKPEGAEAEPTLVGEAHPEGPAQEQFALPFAWEKSPDEPLSKTRVYLREMARDNAAYMRRGPAFFKPAADAESPRATVVSCADSRVQPEAWDTTPENDAFTVRNLGNQIDAGMGAIQYGVDTLATPLLVVLGHTGCGAIKAALSGTAKLSEPIRRELASLKVGKKKPKKLDDKILAQAAVDNVNDQVERALGTFTARVNSGQLTIIGAVYDFRNDLGKGPGKISIVNVNGITEPGRLKAFHDAVLAGANLGADGKPKPTDPFERLSQVFAEHMHESDDDDEDDAPAQPAAAPAPVPAAVPIQAPTTAPSVAHKPHAVAPAHGALTSERVIVAPARGALAPAHAEPPAPGTIPAAVAKPAHR
jgi:carbonic anhydrase